MICSGGKMIRAIFVDDRLLHGSISLKWASYFHLTDILIVNNETVNDEFTKMILDLAKPKNVNLHFKELNRDAMNFIDTFNHEIDNAAIIVSNMFDSKQLIDQMNFKSEVIITGLRERPNCISISDRVALSSEDVSILRKMIKAGYDLKIQSLPNDDAVLINNDYLDGLENQ